MSPRQYTRGVVLFTLTDLRVHDNALLKRANESPCPYLFIVCLDPQYFALSKYKNKRTQIFRAHFLLECINDLRQNLAEIGQELYVAYGSPLKVLPALLKIGQPEEKDHRTIVLTSAQPCINEIRGNAKLAKVLGENTTLEDIWQLTLHHPDDLPSCCQPEDMPTTFTKWRKRMESQKNPNVRQPYPSPNKDSFSKYDKNCLGNLPVGMNGGFDYLPCLTELGFVNPDTQLAYGYGGAMEDSEDKRFIGGETAALKRLHDWMWNQDRLGSYYDTKNNLSGQGYSSKLSPWISMGCLSPRTVYFEIKRYEESRVRNRSTSWMVNQLQMRDYFEFIAVKYGVLMFCQCGPQCEFQKWKDGKLIHDHNMSTDSSEEDTYFADEDDYCKISGSESYTSGLQSSSNSSFTGSMSSNSSTGSLQGVGGTFDFDNMSKLLKNDEDDELGHNNSNETITENQIVKSKKNKKPKKEDKNERVWRCEEKFFQRWKEGNTGWPLIDASMRELKVTGYLSNRARQNVASFLVNELKFDWRWGADYFESMLLDHDTANNYCNWLQVATLMGGRINRFNIIKQSLEYDPDGEYIRKWCPELRNVPSQDIHTPWVLSKLDMKRYEMEAYPRKMNSLWRGYRQL